ncbi:hypothetical protein [Methylobacterium sp. WSM2598]|uniref:hypothetical protein n=1 Tax=Methylobacterium sp. WSM2598 TaxID=398261 RepID=UPI0012F62850|nr:hypothetical protein [Methylobacterium sp. WSM2598]
MRVLVTALAVILASARMAAALERMPRISKGAFYDRVRPMMMESGWQPVPIPKDQQGCAPGREDVCEHYPEAEACSGTGMAYCIFVWRKNEAQMRVTTTGEELTDLIVSDVNCEIFCQAQGDAVTVPRFDTEAACRKITTGSIGYVHCVQREQTAYDYLRIVWHRLNEKAADYCAKAAERQPTPYTWLEACFTGQMRGQQMERDRLGPAPVFRP